MEKVQCPVCGKESYSSSVQHSQCPFCSMERYIIVNPAILGHDGRISREKILIDRRVSNRPVSVDRRKHNPLPVGWLIVKTPIEKTDRMPEIA